ncbi:MAG: hypothetical protein KGI47_02430 [Betaproteobacteria bacterium]|nr:hypothetical protein [Betaproteobacteria bacterium]MDE2622198.1 hypothetical protein [Betaproteobacteria bacterium]
MMRRSLIRQAARLLLVTVLFQASLVAGAWAAFDGVDNGTSRVQVCTGSGLRWVQVQGGDSVPHPAPACHHCALCGCLAADLPPDLSLPSPAPSVSCARQSWQPLGAFSKNIPGQRPPTRAPPVFA